MLHKIYQAIRQGTPLTHAEVWQLINKEAQTKKKPISNILHKLFMYHNQGKTTNYFIPTAETANQFIQILHKIKPTDILEIYAGRGLTSKLFTSIAQEAGIPYRATDNYMYGAPSTYTTVQKITDQSALEKYANQKTLVVAILPHYSRDTVKTLKKLIGKKCALYLVSYEGAGLDDAKEALIKAGYKKHHLTTHAFVVGDYWNATSGTVKQAHSFANKKTGSNAQTMLFIKS